MRIASEVKKMAKMPTTQIQDKLFKKALEKEKLLFMISGAPYNATGGSQRPQQLVDAIADEYAAVHFSYKNGRHFNGNVAIGNNNEIQSWIANAPKGIKKVFSTAFPDKPTTEIITRLGDDWIVHYDCVDDWSGFSHNQWFEQKNENAIIKRADLITTTGRTMFGRLLETKGLNSDVNIRWLPNSTRCKIDGSDWLENRNIDLGFVGFLLDNWIDFELINKLSKLYKIRIIGEAPAIKTKSKNIEWTGKKDHTEIIALLSECKVGIIPFKNLRLSYAVNPIKYFDYLAAGLPSVASFMPEIEEAPAAYVEYNTQDFIKRVADLLRNPIDHKQILSYAKGQTSQDRANTLRKWYDKL